MYVWLHRGPHKMLPAGCNLPTPGLHNRLSADFPSRVLLFNEALPWSLTKPQIVTLFYLARLVRSLKNKSCKRLGSRPKRPSAL